MEGGAFSNRVCGPGHGCVLGNWQASVRATQEGLCLSVHTLGGFKQSGIYSFTVWNPEVQDQGTGRTTLRPGFWGGAVLACLLVSRGGWPCSTFRGWQPCLCSLCLHRVARPSSPLCVSLFSLLIRTPVTGLGSASTGDDLSLT